MSIEVVDNGKGMTSDDLKMCLERHATSKIGDGDLVNINSLGFRGEALYAIASVSKLEIISKTKNMQNAIFRSCEAIKTLTIHQILYSKILYAIFFSKGWPGLKWPILQGKRRFQTWPPFLK